MRITFRTNLGMRDARRHGLDHAECTVGSTCDVEQSAAVALVSQGLATKDVVKAVPPPAAVQGVPDKPDIRGESAQDTEPAEPPRKGGRKPTGKPTDE
jgi:hypothetical protein